MYLGTNSEWIYWFGQTARELKEVATGAKGLRPSPAIAEAMLNFAWKKSKTNAFRLLHDPRSTRNEALQRQTSHIFETENQKSPTFLPLQAKKSKLTMRNYIHIALIFLCAHTWTTMAESPLENSWDLEWTTGEESLIRQELEWAERAMEAYKQKTGTMPLRSSIQAAHVHTEEWRQESITMLSSTKGRSDISLSSTPRLRGGAAAALANAAM